VWPLHQRLLVSVVLYVLRPIVTGTCVCQPPTLHRICIALRPREHVCLPAQPSTHQAVQESTYVQVLENRIEWNYPGSHVTCNPMTPWAINCHVQDRIQVYAFYAPLSLPCLFLLVAHIIRAISPFRTPHLRLFFNMQVVF
jgi:hypothetical protein